MTEDELKAAYQARMRHGAPPPDAPDPEAIQRVATGRATEAERLRVLDIVMQSEALRQEYELFRTLAQVAPAPAPRVPRLPVALAAALLGTVLVGSLWWRRHEAPAEPFRGPDAGVVLHGPAGGARVSQPVRLSWAPVPGASSYTVNVVAETGSSVFATSGTDTLVFLPDSLLIPPGETWVWHVVARLQDGRTLVSEARTLSGAP